MKLLWTRNDLLQKLKKKYSEPITMIKDINLWIYLLITCLIVIWYIYLAFENNWWTNISPLSPNWGNSQTLVLGIYFLFNFCINFTFYKISQNIVKEYKNEIHGLMGFNTVLSLAFLYSLSPDNNNYNDIFICSIFQFVLMLVSFFLSYLFSDDLMILCSLLSCLTIIYISLWSYSIKKNR